MKVPLRSLVVSQTGFTPQFTNVNFDINKNRL